MRKKYFIQVLNSIKSDPFGVARVSVHLCGPLMPSEEHFPLIDFDVHWALKSP